MTPSPDRHRHSHPAAVDGQRSLLMHSALLRGVFATALCALLAAVMVWAALA